MAGAGVVRLAAAGALLAGVLSTAPACRQKQLAVVEDSAADDFGMADLAAAVSEMVRTPDDPAAYRKLAVRIEELRPRFNDRVAAEAELELCFLAIGPLRAALIRSPAEQLEQLGTTVWPTAFRVETTAAEPSRAYLARLCSGAMASECKYVVPEAWPEVMGAKVWRRMKTRTREAFGNCSRCQRDPSYQRVLEDYDRHDTEWQRRVRLLGDRAEPGFWPRAGAHAAPWSAAALLELGADTIALGGEPLGDVEWRRALRERRGDQKVLGIHLRPRQEVRILRAAIDDVARAGWSEIALQVRDATFPFPLREYRLSVRRRGERLAVRDVDTIQVLVQALDATAGRLAARDPAHPAPISL